MVLEIMHCKFMTYMYESNLKPCSYHKPVNAKMWSQQFVRLILMSLFEILQLHVVLIIFI